MRGSQAEIDLCALTSARVSDSRLALSTATEMNHEGLCNNHRRDLRPGHPGASLAHDYGKAEPGDGPLVSAHHPGDGCSRPLGLAREPRPAEVVTGTVGIGN